jgi:hypothetical protein
MFEIKELEKLLFMVEGELWELRQVLSESDTVFENDREYVELNTMVKKIKNLIAVDSLYT